MLDLPDGFGPTTLLDPGDDLRRVPGRPRSGLTEVRLRLTTALGLDDHPATVPSFGAIQADTARALLDRHHGGEWRVVLTDPEGHLQHVLLARRRPTRSRGPDRTRGLRRARRRTRSATRPAAVVELQVPTTLLAALHPDDHPLWAPLLTELQRRVHALGGPRGVSTLGPPGADTEPRELARRRARVELERWIRVRDRCCVAPGCRRQAGSAEIDHTREHARGGPTAHGKHPPS